jgi:hypothetical protein
MCEADVVAVMAKLKRNVAHFNITEVAHPAHDCLTEWIVVQSSGPDVSDDARVLPGSAPMKGMQSASGSHLSASQSSYSSANMIVMTRRVTEGSAGSGESIDMLFAFRE